VRTQGQHRIHTLEANGLRDIELWAARTRQVWESRLDALERELHTQDAKASLANATKSLTSRKSVKS
jgi:hypothetical protein